MGIDWKRKLTSRKFWAAVALFVSGIMTATGRESQAETVAGLIMQGAAVVAYIIGEGLTDAASMSESSDGVKLIGFDCGDDVDGE